MFNYSLANTKKNDGTDIWYHCLVAAITDEDPAPDQVRIEKMI